MSEDDPMQRAAKELRKYHDSMADLIPDEMRKAHEHMGRFIEDIPKDMGARRRWEDIKAEAAAKRREGRL